MKKLSVVISAYNEELKIKDCLESVKFADEIIFIDNSSTDKTQIIARKYTDKIFKRENNLMLNANKNFGFEEASGDWILSLDADERVSSELRKEIQDVLKKEVSLSGFKIPRKNIIFGKWIENTGWYPDYQIRLFKKNKGKFAQKHVHELLDVNGDVGIFKEDIVHYNYESIGQFLDKMIRIYTESEAKNLVAKGYEFKLSDAIRMPISEFLSRFFLQKGYKDGAHGLVLSLLMAFYHFVVFTKLWELNKFRNEDENTLELFGEEYKKTSHDIEHWIRHEKKSSSKNPLRRFF